MILLLICVGVLTAGLVWLISKEHLLMGNYIISYVNDNPKAAALVAEYGNATLFEYSLDVDYNKMTVEIEEYRYGKLTNVSKKAIELPEHRGKKSMFGISPELNEGEFHFTCSFDGGTAYDDVPASTETIDDRVELAGYSIRTSEICKKIEIGECIPIYAYMTGKDSLTVPVEFGYIVNQPNESLDSTELCYLIYVAFE